MKFGIYLLYPPTGYSANITKNMNFDTSKVPASLDPR